MWKRFVFISAIFATCLFIAAIVLEEFALWPLRNNDYLFLEEYGSVDVLVTDPYIDHGYIYMKDTIVVWGGNRMLYSTSERQVQLIKERMERLYGHKEYTPTFEFVLPPFRVIKERADSTFMVIQEGDTMIFELKYEIDEK